MVHLIYALVLTLQMISANCYADTGVNFPDICTGIGSELGNPVEAQYTALSGANEWTNNILYHAFLGLGVSEGNSFTETPNYVMLYSELIQQWIYSQIDLHFNWFTRAITYRA